MRLLWENIWRGRLALLEPPQIDSASLKEKGYYVHENIYYHYRTLRSNKQRHPRAPSPAASPVAQQSLRLAQHLPAGSSQACLAEQCGRQGQMGDKQDAPSLLQCLQASPLFRVRVSGCAARRFSIKNSNVLATARPLAPNANVKPINRQSSVPAQRCLSSSWPPECDWRTWRGRAQCHVTSALRVHMSHAVLQRLALLV